MRDDVEVLAGGNTNAAVVRHGDVVHRAAGSWTPSVHALLAHLEAAGFPAPRGRGWSGDVEVLTYVPGEVVHPHHWDLLSGDEALRDVFALIRRLHDLTSSYRVPDGAVWRDLGADPSGRDEVLCHNDLGPYNLVRSGSDWVFIDWDLAAPGRRGWDLAWALLTLVPLQPDFGLPVAHVGRRLRVALQAYGVAPAGWPALLDLVAERTRINVGRITDGAGRGEEPWLSLAAGGHVDIWERALAHALARREQWLAAAFDAESGR